MRTSRAGERDSAKKAIGWSDWERTAPTPMPDASVSMINRASKSGKPKIGTATMACFRASTAAEASADQEKLSFRSNWVRGAANFP
ncbi:hypothetical protein Syun_019721 [Stephania yunnanensis]|uniref:Uncharacterized protein n=1 Tax=Stephania yunnanensis TaxID=152371 RepID=A0AAP0IUQ6_9MAGN